MNISMLQLSGTRKNTGWPGEAKLDVKDTGFDRDCEEAFDKNMRPELMKHNAKDVWKLTNSHKFILQAVEGMGIGVVTNKDLRSETIVLSEKGLSGTKDGLRLPAALLSTGVELHSSGGNPENYPDSYSPFPDYSLVKWNKARMMASTNSFTMGSNKRMLCNFVSRFNHSCEPNLVRRHKGPTIELITTRAIKKGEQLTIQYSPESGHEDQSHFVCTCTATIDTREATAQRGREIVADFYDSK